ncbi:hypothetical protein WA1_42635 [Scytonema hofmannii PCC 7110]|uniref:Uncharacterized protein n=1 Tax=Scytonema hofmannii PCC 7110 TaxID=128403 RepID=A0A139WVF0_9CYAN|nr:hypothetical protein [Scytonema hofmannii]KYC36407.1 hypothetical protein WA1_42635 [Scytonema hofmannii PCC 7110]
MGRKNKNQINHSVFNQMDRKALLECSQILGVETTRLIKGGIISELSNKQLRSGINRCLSQGTFPNRIERLAFFLEEWIPTELDAPDWDEIDPTEKVMELIEEVRSSFERLSDLQQLEVLTAWIENPQSSCCCEELDLTAETLGFSYEEIDDEYILVLPSPDLVATKIISMSDAGFYHSVIALAALSLPTEKYSKPPSIFCAGYNFLKELAEYFAFIAD